MVIFSPPNNDTYNKVMILRIALTLNIAFCSALCSKSTHNISYGYGYLIYDYMKSCIMYPDNNSYRL